MLSLLRKHSADLLLSLASLVIGIIILVVIGIIFHPSLDEKWHDPNTQFDAELGWSPIPSRSVTLPDGKIISSNENGFRSPAVLPDKPIIFLVGDSVTFGYGVDDANSLSYLMNPLIPTHQVLNLGVSGYGIDQYYLFLEQHISRFKPEHVFLIIYTGNDLQNTSTDTAYGRSKPLFRIHNNQLRLDGVPIAKDSCSNYLTTSFLWRFMGRFDFFKGIFYGMESIREKYCNVQTLAAGERDEVIGKLIDKLRELSADNNATMHFVILTPKNDVYTPSYDTIYFRKYFSDANIPVLDFARIIQFDENVSNWYIDSAHYSDAGNKRLADYLSEQVN